MIDTDELKRVAEVTADKGLAVTTLEQWSNVASPQTILALIAELEEARNDVENWNVAKDIFKDDPRMQALQFVDIKLKNGWEPK